MQRKDHLSAIGLYRKNAMNAPNRTTTTRTGSAGNGGQVLRETAESVESDVNRAYSQRS